MCHNKLEIFDEPMGFHTTPNVQAQGREAGLPAKRPSGAVG